MRLLIILGIFVIIFAVSSVPIGEESDAVLIEAGKIVQSVFVFFAANNSFSSKSRKRQPVQLVIMVVH